MQVSARLKGWEEKKATSSPQRSTSLHGCLRLMLHLIILWTRSLGQSGKPKIYKPKSGAPGLLEFHFNCYLLHRFLRFPLFSIVFLLWIKSFSDVWFNRQEEFLCCLPHPCQSLSGILDLIPPEEIMGTYVHDGKFSWLINSREEKMRYLYPVFQSDAVEEPIGNRSTSLLPRHCWEKQAQGDERVDVSQKSCWPKFCCRRPNQRPISTNVSSVAQHTGALKRQNCFVLFCAKVSYLRNVLTPSKMS